MKLVVQQGIASQAVLNTEVLQELRYMRSAFDDFNRGTWNLTFTPGRSRLLPRGYAPPSRYGDAQAEPSTPTPGPRSLPPRPFPSPDPAPRQQTCSDTLLPQSALQQLEQGSERPPEHSMSRKTQTLTDLWREWTLGIPPFASIEELDRRFGSRWRAGRQKELQWYSSRKVLIDEIKKRAPTGTPEELATVVREWDAVRKREGWSLDYMSRELRKIKRGIGDEPR
jgi:hypothetical protein